MESTLRRDLYRIMFKKEPTEKDLIPLKKTDCEFFIDVFVKCIKTEDSHIRQKCEEIQKDILKASLLDTYLNCIRNVRWRPSES